ncbi:MAG: CBS domain-containing protein [Actinomycetes bacterium]|jgi:CBS domain-containing protein|nr:MAG: histidine kinase [Actinomycetota bacterium]
MQVNELIGAEVFECKPDTTISAAAKLMVQHETGSLAVTDDDGELVGIVTERDVMKVVADGGDPDATKVSEVMTPDPDFLDPDVEVNYAADWMLAAGYRHLPIKDEHGRLLGVLSIKDVLWGVTQGRDTAV